MRCPAFAVAVTDQAISEVSEQGIQCPARRAVVMLAGRAALEPCYAADEAVLAARMRYRYTAVSLRAAPG